MTKILASIGCLLALAVSPAFAQDTPIPVDPTARTRYPNFLGATGLLYTPSAYTLGDRTWAAHIHGNSDFVGGGVLGGISERLEVGLTILDADEEDRSLFRAEGTEVVLNAKLQLLQETASVPAFSVGVIDAFDQLSDDPSWYVVVSKYFTRGTTDQPFSLIGHLGYGGGLFDDELFAGAQLLFEENWGVLAEIQNGNFNVGLRGRWEGLSGTIGLFDLKHFGAGVAYTAQF